MCEPHSCPSLDLQLQTPSQHKHTVSNLQGTKGSQDQHSEANQPLRFYMQEHKSCLRDKRSQKSIHCCRLPRCSTRMTCRPSEKSAKLCLTALKTASAASLIECVTISMSSLVNNLLPDLQTQDQPTQACQSSSLQTCTKAHLNHASQARILAPSCERW